MEINDFDKIVKEQMEKMEISPSESSRKALAFKLFFANLIVFHKWKLYTGFFVLVGGIYVSSLFINPEENTIQKNENIVTVDTDIDVTSEESLTNTNIDKNEHVNTNEISEVTPEKGIAENSSFSNKNTASTVNKNSTSTDNYTNSSIQKSNKVNSNSSNEANLLVEKHTFTDNSSLQNEIENTTKSGSIASDNNTVLTEKTAQKNSSKNDLVDQRVIDATTEDMEKATIIPGEITTEVSPENTLPNPIPTPQLDDYANNAKKRGFTIDAYFSPINKVDIDNQLDASLQEFNWDFYKEFGYVNSGTNGGLNINYNWNNFKLGTGFQINTLRDYKSKYEYYFLPPFFGNQFISGAIVYEQDTSLVFYVDPMDKELHKELQNPYNTYSYLNIPLTLGYELDLKYLSLEINGGIQYGRLIKATGIEVRTGEIINDPLSAYYYNDKYIGMMTRKSDYLNKNQFALLGNATLRVRLSPSLDIYASVNYTSSKKSIYKDNYFLQKTFNSYGTKFGVTYYMNKRLKIRDTTAPKF